MFFLLVLEPCKWHGYVVYLSEKTKHKRSSLDVNKIRLKANFFLEIIWHRNSQ